MIDNMTDVTDRPCDRWLRWVLLCVNVLTVILLYIMVYYRCNDVKNLHIEAPRQTGTSGSFSM